MRHWGRQAARPRPCPRTATRDGRLAPDFTCVVAFHRSSCRQTLKPHTEWRVTERGSERKTRRGGN
ncbi:hypothetical protein EJB05_37804, partial [Eragrostis curvula]